MKYLLPFAVVLGGCSTRQFVEKQVASGVLSPKQAAAVQAVTNTAHTYGILAYAVLVGIGLVGLGVFLAVEGSVKLGMGLMAMGGTFVACGLLLAALQPYELWIAAIGGIIGLLALVWHLEHGKS